jgi:hypothetical protein
MDLACVFRDLLQQLLLRGRGCFKPAAHTNISAFKGRHIFTSIGSFVPSREIYKAITQ